MPSSGLAQDIQVFMSWRRQLAILVAVGLEGADWTQTRVLSYSNVYKAAAPQAAIKPVPSPVFVWVQGHVLGPHSHALNMFCLAGDIHQEGQHTRVPGHQLGDCGYVQVNACRASMTTMLSVDEVKLYRKGMAL